MPFALRISSHADRCMGLSFTLSSSPAAVGIESLASSLLSIGPCMPSLIATDTASRTFAEFPITKLWQEVGQHIRSLHGANFVGFTTDASATSLKFQLSGYDFFVEEAGPVFAFSVAAECPERLLHKVQSHFAALLSTHLRD